MICRSCGQPIPDGANFCGNCGEKVETKQFCTICGTERKEGQLFCSGCGLKFDLPGPVNPPSPGGSGQLLMTFSLVSLYEGEPKMGYAKASGQLSVYNDRLELKKQLGSALGGAFGPVGVLLARRAVKKDPVEIYPLSEISSFKVGKYAGVYNTLVLTFKSGKVISLCPPTPKSADPQKIIDQLAPYL